MKKLHLSVKILSFGMAAVWVLAGVVTISGVFISTSYLLPNLLVGIIFLSIGVFLYVKSKLFLDYIYRDIFLKSKESYSALLITEAILYLLCFFLGAILLSGASYRVFYEGFAVFG